MVLSFQFSAGKGFNWQKIHPKRMAKAACVLHMSTQAHGTLLINPGDQSWQTESFVKIGLHLTEILRAYLDTDRHFSNLIKRPLMRKSPKFFKVVSGGYWNCSMNPIQRNLWGSNVNMWFYYSQKTLIHCICHLSQKHDISDIMGLKNYVHSLSSEK